MASLRVREERAAAITRELQNRDITPNDYELLRSLDEDSHGDGDRESQRHTPNQSLTDYLSSALPMLPISTITRCVSCGSTNAEGYKQGHDKKDGDGDGDGRFFRTLRCGHAMHGSCLRRELDANLHLQCRLDATPIFTALQKKKRRTRKTIPTNGRWYGQSHAHGPGEQEDTFSMMAGLDGCIQGVRITSGPGDGDGESIPPHPHPQHGRRKGCRRTMSAPAPGPVANRSLELTGATVTRVAPPKFGRRAIPKPHPHPNLRSRPRPTASRRHRHNSSTTAPTQGSTNSGNAGGKLAKGLAFRVTVERRNPAGGKKSSNRAGSGGMGMGMVKDVSPDPRPWHSPDIDEEQQQSLLAFTDSSSFKFP